MSLRKMLETRIPAKEIAPAMVLVFSSLVWFTLVSSSLGASIENLTESLSSDSIVIHGFYYAGIAASAILGAHIFPRRREDWLYAWMLFGVMTTWLLTVMAEDQLVLNMLIALVLGVSIGMGLPSALAYFADTTLVENRGTYGGLTWITVGFGILSMAIVLGSVGILTTLIVLGCWRAAGLVAFFMLSRLRGRLQPSARAISYREILGRRDVTLYLLPWIMFSIVNFAESPILKNVFGSDQQLIGFIEFAISGVFAVVGGILGDLVGRKRVVITGFVILGLEYAVLTLFSGTWASRYVYTVCDGIAWGMFASVFFMTLWGDLAETRQKEKYYALGGLPYLLAGFLPVVIGPIATQIETVTAFSLAAFFLFLAVLPLMYAPETLPEKKIKERELKDYVEKAKRAKEKYA